MLSLIVPRLEVITIMKLVKCLLCIALFSTSVLSHSFDYLPLTDSAQTSVKTDPINWKILSDFGDFYTSFALETSNVKKIQSPSPFYIGDYYGQVGIEIETVSDDSILKIKAKLSNLISEGEQTIILPKAGKYKVYPHFIYNYELMYLEKGARNVNLLFDISLNGVDASKSIPLRILGINDALIASKVNNKIIPNKFVFAQYVNENHPAIDGILREALDLPVRPVDSFNGYQGSQGNVYDQIFSIWYLLQRHGVTYSSILTPEAVNEFAFSQYVRTFGEVLQNRQANCIDGTVFFASILRKIGIDSVIVIKPGHAYLGFYTSPSKRNMDFLETTMVGHGGNDVQARNTSMERLKIKFARTFQIDNKMEISRQYFNAAINQGRRNFNNDRGHYSSKDATYRLIDIEESRRMGVTPLNL